jgi:hypothetical protein
MDFAASWRRVVIVRDSPLEKHPGLRQVLPLERWLPARPPEYREGACPANSVKSAHVTDGLSDKGLRTPGNQVTRRRSALHGEGTSNASTRPGAGRWFHDDPGGVGRTC